MPTAMAYGHLMWRYEWKSSKKNDLLENVFAFHFICFVNYNRRYITFLCHVSWISSMKVAATASVKLSNGSNRGVALAKHSRNVNVVKMQRPQIADLLSMQLEITFTGREEERGEAGERERERE